jgi:SOS-response transcriptional repressor LexA
MRNRTFSDRQLLTAIMKLTNDYGYAPTIRELRTELNLSSTGGLQTRMLSLEKSKLLTSQYGKARTVKVTDLGQRFLSSGKDNFLILYV